MKSFSILVLIVVVGSVSGGPTGRLSWEEYKGRYGKEYSTNEEDSMRKELYEESLRDLNRFNLLSTGLPEFKRGINHLSDWTSDELKQLGGLRLSPEEYQQLPLAGKGNFLRGAADKIPDSVDWRKTNRVSPVKDQGKCGSCWSFATTGLLEGQEFLNMTGRMPVDLSEQNLIDCDKKDHGCHGGSMAQALFYVAQNGGLMREMDYQYVSGDGSTEECQYKPEDAFVTTRKVIGPARVEATEEGLKKAVALYGPVSVGIDASHKSLATYSDGIYYEPSCSSEALDHAVLVVGYGSDGDNQDYWIVKNSWSSEWGQDGYFKLARNRDNHCGIATFPIIAES